MNPVIKFEVITANLMVADVDKTVDFYRDILGFATIATVPDSSPLQWAMLQRDEVTLMFQETNNLIDEYPILSGRTPGTGLSLYINVNDINELFTTLKGRVTILKEPHTTFYGSHEFAILDCNDTVLTFAQRG